MLLLLGAGWAAALAASYAYISQAYRLESTRQQTEQVERLSLAALEISRELVLRRRMVEQLASRREVRDMAAIADEQAAESWVQSLRPLLPDAVGLAVVLPDGVLLGDGRRMRVGPQCVEDLHAMLGLQPPSESPVVHAGVPALAHYDLPVRILDDTGRPLGLLFASFHLGSLQDALRQMDSRWPLRLTSAGGILLAGGVPANETGLRPLSLRVPDSSWQLTAWFPAEAAMHPAAVLALLLGGIVFALSVALFFLGRRLLRLFRRDMAGIVRFSEAIEQGLELPPLAVALQDNLPLMQHLGLIGGRMLAQQHELRELARTDALTGLPNRRALLHEIGRALHLERRGVGFTLALLEMEGMAGGEDPDDRTARDAGLKLLARELGHCVREPDVGGRVEGARFAILFHTQAPTPRVPGLLAQLRTAFKAALAAEGLAAADFSVGLVRLDADRHGDPEAALMAAVQALEVARPGAV
jgi:GGDEF domain-containing protein